MELEVRGTNFVLVNKNREVTLLYEEVSQDKASNRKRRETFLLTRDSPEKPLSRLLLTKERMKNYEIMTCSVDKEKGFIVANLVCVADRPSIKAVRDLERVTDCRR